jgi:deoxyribodipyrimidine photo-lyase
MSLKPSIHWFRQDLRLHDNASLHALAQTGQPIIPLYILEDDPHNPWPLGQAQKWWLHHSLNALNASLDHQLIIRQGRPEEILRQIIAETGASTLSWNRRYDPYGIREDTCLKNVFKQKGLEVYSYNSHLLFEPWTIATGEGAPYKVFTPFWKACGHKYAIEAPFPKVGTSHFYGRIQSLQVDDLHLLPHHPNWAKGFEGRWHPGEEGAYTQAGAFIKERVEGYKEGRNIPAHPWTSRLSPHLHFGEISVRWLWHQVHDHGSSGDHAHFLSELGWREFSHHLLYHFPHLPEKAFRPAFDHFPWRSNPEFLKRWQQGLTGYPIIDAGMRELWITGWMHNRVRMIVASFLIKNLMIDWREGQKWFHDTLLDADVANNAAGWQWVAGSGADAAPYFRIFNPLLQGEKFDPQGDYVRTWVPELKDLVSTWIHKPFEAPPLVLRKAGVILGKTYPTPLVDLKESREKALSAYKTMNHD